MESELDVDKFLYEVMKVFCALHELEIDMLMQLYQGMSMDLGLDFTKFRVALDCFEISQGDANDAHTFVTCSQSFGDFCDFMLDRWRHFDNGAYQPLIEACAHALSALS